MIARYIICIRSQGKVNTFNILRVSFIWQQVNVARLHEVGIVHYAAPIYELEKAEPASVNIDFHYMFKVLLKLIYTYLVLYMLLLRHGFT